MGELSKIVLTYPRLVQPFGFHACAFFTSRDLRFRCAALPPPPEVHTYMHKEKFDLENKRVGGGRVF